MLGLFWLGAVGWGFHLAFAYQGAPGKPALSSGAWPDGVPLERDPQRLTLVLAAHPQCPCTRATLRELERLVSRCQEQLRVHVLFYSDPALGLGWERSDLWSRASSIPGVEVVADPLGAIASLFGARISGQVFLFTPDARLVFEGGITAARGHEGDNPGADAVADWVTKGSARGSHAPVFGCELAERDGVPPRP